MCIRDSRGVLVEATGDEPPLVAVAVGKPFAGDDGAAPFEAVSYTHLRAHETVLDLVCRLLLEKTHPRQISRPRHTPLSEYPHITL